MIGAERALTDRILAGFQQVHTLPLPWHVGESKTGTDHAFIDRRHSFPLCRLVFLNKVVESLGAHTFLRFTSTWNEKSASDCTQESWPVFDMCRRCSEGASRRRALQLIEIHWTALRHEKNCLVGANHEVALSALRHEGVHEDGTGVFQPRRLSPSPEANARYPPYPPLQALTPPSLPPHTDRRTMPLVDVEMKLPPSLTELDEDGSLSVTFISLDKTVASDTAAFHLVS